MKLLLDENLPKKLKYRFPSTFNLITVPELEWGGVKNGDLLKKMNDENLKVLISIDKSFNHQQNLITHSVCLIVLKAKDNRYETLLKFMPKLLSVLNNALDPGVILIEQ
ncbi:hypothetical protein EI546_10775 [Aequorivita sp. H23M31]|uniref:DUF5615 domain-containing protein n=1 Tax=Aequorivita ciconiae TaxID=2494375 RepID=A0A410G4J8_9FLAO|nr:DUF5615 family PIN-like protein [Aequorivita sp. H23M31]QAA82176.1 hypothetical protein EI546_10775 [Aequorivita sp. H23M31]